MPNPFRRLSVPPLTGLEGQGRGSVGGGGPPGEGYRIPFLRPPPLSTEPIPIPSYAPTFHQGGCSRGGHPGVDFQGCCGACSSSLSRLLQPPVCGLEDLGVVVTGHRPVPPPSLRGRFTLPHGDHPVCSSVCPAGDWMASIYLQEAYLQVPVRPESRCFLLVRGSCNPHLFPICSGGGGGSMSPLSPLLRGLFSVTGCGGLPFQFLCGSWGFPF